MGSFDKFLIKFKRNLKNRNCCEWLYSYHKLAPIAPVNNLIMHMEQALLDQMKLFKTVSTEDQSDGELSPMCAHYHLDLSNFFFQMSISVKMFILCNF